MLKKCTSWFWRIYTFLAPLNKNITASGKPWLCPSGWDSIQTDWWRISREQFQLFWLNFSNLRRRIHMQGTNGSKTAVMHVIGFLGVSLGSSIIQLHDSLGCRGACSKAGFSSQNGDRRAAFSRAGFFFGRQKDSMQRIIHKVMFPVYGGKCLSRKAVHNWVANVSLMTRRLKRMCGSGWDNSQKTSKLRVSTHW
jgi:hypothetical protein